MSRIEAMRNRIPAPLRPFTRGVWPYLWVAAAAVASWWVLGGATFEEASAARERVANERRLVRAMRDAAASEGVERERVASLVRWMDESGPARVVAPSVQIGLSRLQEKIQALATSAAEGVTLLPADAGAAQVETIVESTPEGRSFHLVRVPFAVRTETVDAMTKVMASIESNDDLWLRPGNSTLTTDRLKQGQAARWNAPQVWAVIEVRPERS